MSPFMKAVINLRPGVDFSNRDNTLAGIRWDTPGVEPPTQAEIDAEIARMAAAKPQTLEQRVAELEKQTAALSTALKV